MKKTLFLLITLFFNLVSYAQTSGEAGYLSWNYENGLLTISGDYVMPSYSNVSYSFAPWYDIRNLITQVKIVNGVKSIGGEAFIDCVNLTQIQIPSSVTEIKYSAFKNCESLVSIVLPNSVAKIGATTFYNCTSLKDITFSSNISDTQYFTFFNCTNLESVKLTSSIELIGNGSFANCSSLKNIDFPNNLRYIGDSSFSGTGLISINIPKTTSEIGTHAFNQCSNLKEVIANWETPLEFTDYYFDDIFGGVNKTECILKVPDDKISLYIQAPIWKDFVNIRGISTSNKNLVDYINNIYPNPISDFLTIDLNEEAVVTIFDNTGSQLIQAKVSSNFKTIDTSLLNPGIYYVHIKTENYSRTLKRLKIQ